MSPDHEREAWLHVITPEDIDVLMAGNGQAEANAAHVRALLLAHPLGPNARLLVHGCGTCQVLDYLKPADFHGATITFADLSEPMLAFAKRRAASRHGLHYRFVIDDIEDTALTGTYEAVLLSMVLLHVDWNKALRNVVGLRPDCVYVIEQERNAGTPATGAVGRTLPLSIQRYAGTVAVKLVPRKGLIDSMKALGYGLVHLRETGVPDGKKMVGMVFARQP